MIFFLTQLFLYSADYKTDLNQDPTQKSSKAAYDLNSKAFDSQLLGRVKRSISDREAEERKKRLKNAPRLFTGDLEKQNPCQKFLSDEFIRLSQNYGDFGQCNEKMILGLNHNLLAQKIKNANTLKDFYRHSYDVQIPNLKNGIKNPICISDGESSFLVSQEFFKSVSGHQHFRRFVVYQDGEVAPPTDSENKPRSGDSLIAD